MPDQDLDQDAIDALLSGGEPSLQHVEAAPGQDSSGEGAAAPGSDLLTQEALDSLLAGDQGPASQAGEQGAAAASGTDVLSQDELDSLLSVAGQTPPASTGAGAASSSSGGDLLSQEEIDALLETMSHGGLPEKAAQAAEDVVQPYDFASPALGVRGFVSTLEMVNERFARLFRMSIFNLFRHYTEVSLYGIQVLTFGEYAHGLGVPVSVNVVRVKPVTGVALLTMDPHLVEAMVNVFFGGGSFPTRARGREFTVAESRVIRRVVDLAMSDLKLAWGSVMCLDFEYLTSEVNPHFVGAVSSSEVVVTAIFRLDMDGRGGEFHVALPYSLLEPLRETLMARVQARGLDRDAAFERAVQRRLETARVEVACLLTEAEISLRELLALKVGDVIPVEVPKTVPLLAEGIPVWRGQYGAAKGRWALRISHEAQGRGRTG